MKIGIDAKWYVFGPPSGVKVVNNIVNGLICDKNNKYVIFVRKRDYTAIRELNKERSNVEIVLVPGINNFIENVLILPFIGYLKNIDVTIYQTVGIRFLSHKAIVYIHDILFYSHPQYFKAYQRLYFKLLLHFARYSNAIITVSETEKKRINTYGIAKKIKKYVVYNGIDERYLAEEPQRKILTNIIKKKYNLPDDYLLFVGRLNNRKNIMVILKAFDFIINQSLSLVIVGPVDDDAKRILQYIRINKKIQERAIILGRVPEVDLPFIYSGASIFCFPSLAEGFGMPPLEAMASGLPTIVSDKTSLPEVCGDCAFYFDGVDFRRLANIIDNISSNITERLIISKRARMRAKKFLWSNTIILIRKVIEEVYRDEQNYSESN